MTDPYNLPQIYDRLAHFVAAEFSGELLTFNLTGGTKPMTPAAYRLAQECSSLFVYFQTEGNRSCLYRYAFGSDGAVHLGGNRRTTRDRLAGRIPPCSRGCV